jgi:hypothetical protein
MRGAERPRTGHSAIFRPAMPLRALSKVRTNPSQRGRQLAHRNGENHKIAACDGGDIAEPDMSITLIFRGQRGIAGEKREIGMQMFSDKPAKGAEAEYAD